MYPVKHTSGQHDMSIYIHIQVVISGDRNSLNQTIEYINTTRKHAANNPDSPDSPVKIARAGRVRRMKAKFLDVSAPFHSSVMHPVEEELRTVLQDIHIGRHPSIHPYIHTYLYPIGLHTYIHIYIQPCGTHSRMRRLIEGFFKYGQHSLTVYDMIYVYRASNGTYHM